MKINSFLIALAATSLAALSAHAQVNYTDGDLLIGFYQTGATNDLIVDAGPVSSLSNGTLNLGNIAPDLTQAFGSGWATSSTLYWGALATNPNFGPTTSRNLTASRIPANGDYAAITAQTLNTAGGELDLSAGATLGVKLSGLNDDLQLASDSKSWAKYSAGNWGGLSNLSVDNASGITSAQLNLYALIQTGNSSSASGPGVLDGSLAIDSNADVTYTAAPVPEPSTYASIALGAASLLMMARRRRA
jgi:hypothetical protein